MGIMAVHNEYVLIAHNSVPISDCGMIFLPLTAGHDGVHGVPSQFSIDVTLADKGAQDVYRFPPGDSAYGLSVQPPCHDVKWQVNRTATPSHSVPYGGHDLPL